MVSMKRFIYRWDHEVTKGVAFAGGLELYKTSSETFQLPHYGLTFWRLNIMWRRDS